MRFLAGFIVALALATAREAEAAHPVSGGSALALGAIVGSYSSGLGHATRAELASALAGHPSAHPLYAVIVVRAASIVCRAGDVDISAHVCTLAFGSGQIRLTGRAAHELYATLVEAGAPGDAAAGTAFESVTHLVCTLRPAIVAARSGGGAACSFTPGP